MSDSIPRIDIDEFHQLGFLQEANRLFFHPHGLALEVIVDDDGTKRLGGIWDYRSDDEGMCFADLSDEAVKEKALAVRCEYERHVSYRKALFGGEVIQPVGHAFPEDA